MVISWLGAASIRISTTPLQEEIVIITDPVHPKSLGITRGKIAADVILVSAPHHPLHNAIDEVRGREDQPPLVITTPGECELKGAVLYGIASQSGKETHAQQGNIFLIKSENITLLHLGHLGQNALTDGQMENLSHIDVLIIEAGDPEGLTPAETAKIVVQIEPRIIIPISYEPGRGKTGFQNIQAFIKALGLEAEAPLVKFKITKKDLPAEETRLVLLSLE